MVKPGDRVEITARMPYEPNPLPIGLQGTVEEVNAQVNQIYVDWDPDDEGRKRTLILLTTDPYRIVRE